MQENFQLRHAGAQPFEQVLAPVVIGFTMEKMREHIAQELFVIVVEEILVAGIRGQGRVSQVAVSWNRDGRQRRWCMLSQFDGCAVR
ncbi:hypothetical protein XF14_09395 [Burkholderia gladioli]|nr:hypothetical protein XF14_09395 [Burkholderia gladioli]